ncbi:MAG: DUF4352 domain-containing protein, partial [Thermoproteota archaeon]
IIIVAVAIVMAIAVAYWMMGLATTFTRYEKLEFVSAYATKADDTFYVNMTIKSTGTSPATVKGFLLNGIPSSEINNVTVFYHNGIFPEAGVTVYSGSEAKFSILIPEDTPIGGTIAVSGVTVEIVIQTAAGNQYPKTIVLP